MSQENKLWTVYCDYSSTWEGRSLMAIICYSTKKQEAIDKFSEQFDKYFSIGAIAKNGVLKNDVTKQLFTESTLNFAKENENRCNLIIHSSLHFNFS